MCTTLGVFGTAHADGNLYLRLLSNLQAGEGPTVNLGDPVQILADDPAAVIQVHQVLPLFVQSRFNVMGGNWDPTDKKLSPPFDVAGLQVESLA